LTESSRKDIIDPMRTKLIKTKEDLAKAPVTMLKRALVEQVKYLTQDERVYGGSLIYCHGVTHPDSELTVADYGTELQRREP